MRNSLEMPGGYKGNGMKRVAKWPVKRVKPESVGLGTPELERIGDLMRRAMANREVAGGVVSVVRRGGLPYLECFGMADVENQRPMQEDTIFRIHSLTKIVTSVAVLMLFEEGRFLMADPVKNWIPEFGQLRVAPGPDDNGQTMPLRRNITIHDLLTHTAGLSYDLVEQARDEDWTIEKFVHEFCKRPLKRQPGLQWGYSAATNVLARLVEVVSGESFDGFLQRRIFQPLGMTDTDFWVPPEKAGRFAQVYTPNDQGDLILATDPSVQGYLRNRTFKNGGGGLVSTTSDYLRFSLALLNGGAWNGVRLLGRKTVELMTADQLPAGHPAMEAAGRGFGFGLGVSVLRTLGEGKQLGSVGEYGWGGTTCTQVWIDPSEETIVLLMIQYLPKGRYTLMDRVKTAAYGAIVD